MDTVPVLKLTINLFQATLFGIGLILGAKIYVIIGEAAEIAGNIISRINYNSFICLIYGTSFNFNL
ncbi:MAG TPA: hypothetical protein VFZ46_00490 [Nitrososphaeraceae archaeon]